MRWARRCYEMKRRMGMFRSMKEDSFMSYEI
jgi:hypothetical protein